MTATAALREARKRWGKDASVRCEKNLALIGQDGKWRGYADQWICEQHGCVDTKKRPPTGYYIICAIRWSSRRRNTE
jgi:hypothetical protein